MHLSLSRYCTQSTFCHRPLGIDSVLDRRSRRRRRCILYRRRRSVLYRRRRSVLRPFRAFALPRIVPPLAAPLTVPLGYSLGR